MGFVGKGETAENGFWDAHLHFAIYTGPWKDQVLPLAIGKTSLPARAPSGGRCRAILSKTIPKLCPKSGPR